MTLSDELRYFMINGKFTEDGSSKKMDMEREVMGKLDGKHAVPFGMKWLIGLQLRDCPGTGNRSKHRQAAYTIDLGQIGSTEPNSSRGASSKTWASCKKRD